VIVEESVVEELKKSFCEVWPLFYSGAYGYTLCNPVFNRRGDLIFELESPLDCNGELAVPDRCDVCLPAKNPVPSRPCLSVTGKSSHEFDIREASYSTILTDHDDSPLRTPTSSHEHSHFKVSIRTGGEEEEEDGESISDEKLRRSSRETVYRSSQKWGIGSGKPTLVK